MKRGRKPNAAVAAEAAVVTAAGVAVMAAAEAAVVAAAAIVGIAETVAIGATEAIAGNLESLAYDSPGKKFKLIYCQALQVF